MYADIAEQWPGDDPHTAAVLEFGVRYEQAILDWLAALPFELEPACATGAVDAGTITRASCTAWLNGLPCSHRWSPS